MHPPPTDSQPDEQVGGKATVPAIETRQQVKGGDATRNPHRIQVIGLGYLRIVLVFDRYDGTVVTAQVVQAKSEVGRQLIGRFVKIFSDPKVKAVATKVTDRFSVFRGRYEPKVSDFNSVTRWPYFSRSVQESRIGRIKEFQGGKKQVIFRQHDRSRILAFLTKNLFPGKAETEKPAKRRKNFDHRFSGGVIETLRD